MRTQLRDVKAACLLDSDDRSAFREPQAQRLLDGDDPASDQRAARATARPSLCEDSQANGGERRRLRQNKQTPAEHNNPQVVNAKPQVRERKVAEHKTRWGIEDEWN